jgi:hypothetical protein
MTKMMNDHQHQDHVDQDNEGMIISIDSFEIISIFSRRISAHASSSSTSDSSSDSEGMGPLTNGDLDSRPQRTARLAKSTALKRMRLILFIFILNTNALFYSLDVYQQI